MSRSDKPVSCQAEKLPSREAGGSRRANKLTSWPAGSLQPSLQCYLSSQVVCHRCLSQPSVRQAAKFVCRLSDSATAAAFSRVLWSLHSSFSPTFRHNASYSHNHQPPYSTPQCHTHQPAPSVLILQRAFAILTSAKFDVPPIFSIFLLSPLSLALVSPPPHAGHTPSDATAARRRRGGDGQPQF